MITVFAIIAGFVLGVGSWLQYTKVLDNRVLRKHFGSSNPSDSQVQAGLLAIDQELADLYQNANRCCQGGPGACADAVFNQRYLRDEVFALALKRRYGKLVETRIRSGLPKPTAGEMYRNW